MLLSYISTVPEAIYVYSMYTLDANMCDDNPV